MEELKEAQKHVGRSWEVPAHDGRGVELREIVAVRPFPMTSEQFGPHGKRSRFQDKGWGRNMLKIGSAVRFATGTDESRHYMVSHVHPDGTFQVLPIGSVGPGMGAVSGVHASALVSVHCFQCSHMIDPDQAAYSAHGAWVHDQCHGDYLRSLECEAEEAAHYARNAEG